MSSLILQLVNTAPLIHKVPTPGGIVKRAKYIARGLAASRSTREWFHFLNDPEMALIIRSHPYLYHKLQRPYLNCTLSTRQRLDALKQHYFFVLDHFSSAKIEALYAKAGLKIAEINLKDLGSYELRLTSSRRQKEGDFSMGLFKVGSDREFFAMAFSIWKYREPCREIFIGGLQGSRAGSKEAVVDLTRAMYGLRPKALLLFSVQQFAMCMGVPNLRAVSDAKHIYRHFQKRKTLAASYDEFWIDCGGKLSGDGMFDLPAIFAPRDISTIKVNKRQMYRRRYEMLENLALQIRTRLIA